MKRIYEVMHVTTLEYMSYNDQKNQYSSGFIYVINAFTHKYFTNL